jgi:tRNA1(Val) A37 N6-methylase TrmN6
MSSSRPSPGPGETLDRLAGEWWIFQLRRGHRYSTDDVLTAWTAVAARPDARRLLDLGAGVGSVGLMTLLRSAPEARLIAVEQLDASVALMRKTVDYNGLGERVWVCHGDLRDPALLRDTGRFDLITANPPYLPEGSALRSPVPQRAAARLELAGDVFDFCRAAARWLAPGGCFCFSHAAGDPRPEQAIAAAELRLRASREVVFRDGRGPVITLYTCEQGRTIAPDRLTPLLVREADGERTDEYRQVRREMLIEE